MATETERPLPEAGLSNPYSLLSREELDAVLAAIDAELADLHDGASAERDRLNRKRRQILDGFLWLMVREGIAEWSGGKPKVPDHPAEVTLGPYISDFVIEDRR